MHEGLHQLTLAEYRRQEAGVIKNALVEVVPIQLTNRVGLSEASASRCESDYTIDNLRLNYKVLPPSIGRHLLDLQPCIERLQEATQLVDNFKLMIIRHSLSSPNEPYYTAPLDLVGSFSYVHDGKKINISGPVMVSQLSHLAFPEMNLDPEIRKEMIKTYFGSYVRALPNHHVGIVSIQPRTEESPTHKSFVESEGILTNPNTGKNYEIMKNNKGNHIGNLYFYAHGGTGSTQYEENSNIGENLMNNAIFRQQINKIVLAWRENIKYVSELQISPEQEALTTQQMYDMSTRLIRTWKERKKI